MVAKRLRLVAVVVLTIVLVLGTAQGVLAADPAAGKAIYDKNACGACHGPTGDGGGGPKLKGDEFNSKYSTGEKLEEIIAKGRGGMPGYPESKIAKPDMANLVAYIQGFSPAAAKGALAQPEAKAQTVESKDQPATKAQTMESKEQAAPKAQPAAPAPAPSAAAEPKENESASALILEQWYVLAVVAAAAVLLLLFALVLNGPLRARRT